MTTLRRSATAPSVLDPADDPGLRLDAPLAQANPVAKLAAATAVGLGLLLSVDPVTAGTAFALELLTLPWCGVRPGALLRRSLVLVVGGVPAGIAAALFGTGGGRSLLEAGPLSLTTGSLAAGAAITLRVLAIGLPGVVLLSTTDPTDLADALAQRLRLPATFVLAALAATRLLGVLVADRQSLALARRARGLGGAGPASAVRSAGGQVFALLVLAVRRATVLATAMEARGFGVPGVRRSWARESVWRRRDGLLVAGSLLLTGVSIAAGVLAGTWRLLLH